MKNVSFKEMLNEMNVNLELNGDNIADLLINDFKLRILGVNYKNLSLDIALSQIINYCYNNLDSFAHQVDQEIERNRDEDVFELRFNFKHMIYDRLLTVIISYNDALIRRSEEGIINLSKENDVIFAINSQIEISVINSKGDIEYSGGNNLDYLTFNGDDGSIDKSIYVPLYVANNLKKGFFVPIKDSNESYLIEKKSYNLYDTLSMYKEAVNMEYEDFYTKRVLSSDSLYEVLALSNLGLAAYKDKYYDLDDLKDKSFLDEIIVNNPHKFLLDLSIIGKNNKDRFINFIMPYSGKSISKLIKSKEALEYVQSKNCNKNILEPYLTNNYLERADMSYLLRSDNINYHLDYYMDMIKKNINIDDEDKFYIVFSRAIVVSERLIDNTKINIDSDIFHFIYMLVKHNSRSRVNRLHLDLEGFIEDVNKLSPESISAFELLKYLERVCKVQAVKYSKVIFLYRDFLDEIVKRGLNLEKDELLSPNIERDYLQLAYKVDNIEFKKVKQEIFKFNQLEISQVKDVDEYKDIMDDFMLSNDIYSEYFIEGIESESIVYFKAIYEGSVVALIRFNLNNRLYTETYSLSVYKNRFQDDVNKFVKHIFEIN